MCFPKLPEDFLNRCCWRHSSSSDKPVRLAVILYLYLFAHLDFLNICFRFVQMSSLYFHSGVRLLKVILECSTMVNTKMGKVSSTMTEFVHLKMALCREKNHISPQIFSIHKDLHILFLLGEYMRVSGNKSASPQTAGEECSLYSCR